MYVYWGCNHPFKSLTDGFVFTTTTIAEVTPPVPVHTLVQSNLDGQITAIEHDSVCARFSPTYFEVSLGSLHETNRIELTINRKPISNHQIYFSEVVSSSDDTHSKVLEYSACWGVSLNQGDRVVIAVTDESGAQFSAEYRIN